MSVRLLLNSERFVRGAVREDVATPGLLRRYGQLQNAGRSTLKYPISHRRGEFGQPGKVDSCDVSDQLPRASAAR